MEHGADIGFEVKSGDLEELFREAGKAVFSVMVDVNNLQAKESVPLELSASTLDDLLYEWLSELVSIANLKNQAYCEFSDLNILETDSGYTLNAVVRGERIDPDRHELGTEVKAVTYQGLEIEKEKDGWGCRYVVDV